MNRYTQTLVALLLLISFAAQSQSFNNYYPDNIMNDIAGYPNAVFDSKTNTYFLVEYDRQIEIAFSSALHVKKVDAFGNLIDERYFITDFMPYSGHYISAVQTQGDEIVVFINRNVGYPHVHDVFIIRIKKDLTGTPASKRLYIDADNKAFNSMKINEVVPYGNKLLFTGSVFTRGDLNYGPDPSKLLMGFVDEAGAVTYQVYQHNADRLEGLSLLPRPKANELYVSVRFTAKDEKAIGNMDLPLIVKMRTFETSFYLDWGKLYPDLRVDVSDYSSYNEGIEVPLIESFTAEKTPAFLARDKETENLVFVPFSRTTGDHISTAVRQISIPTGVELIDAVKMTETTNGLAVLFTRREPYNLWNSESYLLSCPNIYQFLIQPHWQNLTSPVQTHAIQARKILIPAKGELAIAGLVNTIDEPFSGLYRASLMKSDDLSFECVPYKKLKTPKTVPLMNEKIVLKLSPEPILEEEREMAGSVSVFTSKYELCGSMAPEAKTAVETANSNSPNTPDITLYPNPANHQFQIHIPTVKGEVLTLVVYNLMGEIIYQETLQNDAVNVTVHTTQFPEGMYSVQLYSGEGVMVHEKRLILIH